MNDSHGPGEVTGRRRENAFRIPLHRHLAQV